MVRLRLFFSIHLDKPISTVRTWLIYLNTMIHVYQCLKIFVIEQTLGTEQKDVLELTLKSEFHCLQWPVCDLLTLRLSSTTIVSYANSLDPDDMLSNSASYPNQSCLFRRIGRFSMNWYR